jgi:transposase
MVSQATAVTLTAEEQEILVGWASRPTSEQRMALRAKIVLGAADGEGTNRIARELDVRPATVSKWRTRFAQDGLPGLHDAPRSGRRRKYDEGTEQRILAVLDEPVPGGETTWTARLISRELGDVTVHQVWRVLRKHKIHLRASAQLVCEHRS